MIYDRALRMLGRRPHAMSQLRTKLLRTHGGAQELVEAVLHKLIEEEYIDDARYARERIESCLRRRQEGRRVLMARLLRDGIARDVAQEAIQETVSADREREVLHQFAREQRSRGVSVEAFLRAASNRGFSYELVHSAAEEEFDRIET